MKNVKVPDFMLDAAVAAAWDKAYPGKSPQASERVQAEIRESFRVALEAALQALAEHPIVPTDEQIDSFCDALGYNTWADHDACRAEIAIWQRRMFAALEPQVKSGVPMTEFGKAVVRLATEMFQGKTITRDEANEAMEYINQCVAPDEDEAIRDLLPCKMGEKSRDSDVIPCQMAWLKSTLKEAYRRGRESK